MELSQIPAALQSRLRLSVIAALLSGPKKFRTLQDLTGATAGNLGKQLEQLEEEGYLDSKKEFVGRRPQYHLSSAPLWAGAIYPVCGPESLLAQAEEEKPEIKSCRSETSLRQLFWFAVKPSVGRGPRCVRSR